MPTPPDLFLRRAHRRRRSGPLLWALALALLSLALLLAVRLAWLPDAPAAHAARWIFAVAALFVLVNWIRRAARLDAAAHARELDSRLALSSRLESAAELASDRSALAAAQRADASRHLAARPAPPSFAWLSAIPALVLALLLLASALSVLAFRSLRAAPAVDQPAALAPDISASLAWRSPESEIKATAIEEIPLTALADTRTGLRTLSLEVAVNGEPRLSRALDPAALEKLSAPGAHTLELELYLDEVGAQEFDLVSYHLRADRATATPAPAIASPLQFIQIRPAREDVERRQASGDPHVDKLATLIGNLKAAQLQLLKQNFLLAHAPIDKGSPVWRDENTRVAGDQKLLAQKTAEARDYAIAEALPALVVDNLGQTAPLMESAAAQIATAANEPAAKPQGQALGLLASTEKLIRKIIVEGGGAPARTPLPKNHDPFKDKQQFKLPPRAQTPAGQLEQLAHEQADAAQTDAAPAAPEKDPLLEQADLAARLADLAAARSLDPAAQAKTEQAARDAAEAARQLEQNDPEAARAPAAAAAQALREATAAQDEAGRAIARAQLESLRREINAADQLPDPAARAAALAEAAAKLRAEALAQQQTGSAEAARELAAAAAKVEKAAASSPESPGSAPASAPSSAPAAAPTPGEGAGSAPPAAGQAEGSAPGEAKPAASPGSGSGASPAASAAQAAARAQAALTPRDQALARAARQLSAGARPGQGAGSGAAAGRGGGATVPSDEIQLGAQLAAELVTDPEALALARRIVGQTRSDNRPADNLVRIPDDLRDAAHRLVVLLEAARQSGQRDEQVRRFNPDDLDPSYRPAVETYFEKLSRDAAPARPRQ